MKKTQHYLIALFSVLLFSMPAMADKNTWGLFLEPGVTYQVSDANVNNPPPIGESQADNNGFGLMGRVGVHVYESFFVGVDGRYIFNTYKDSQNNYNVDATSMNLAPVIGMQMPKFGLRVWGAYVLWGNLDPKGENNFDLKHSEAQGYRIGAGVRAWSASVNLEYEALDYGSTDLEAPGTYASSDNFDLDSESWILSVSFPFEI